MARHRPLLDTPLKWIGSITALISLVLGLNQVTKLFSEIRERQRQVTELQTIADQQQRGGDYPAAWASINQALIAADQGSSLAKLTGQLGAQRRSLREAQEHLAMAWLENVSVPEGKTFSDLVDPLVPVVTRGIVDANGVRKADLLGHLGWAYFLKSRDGRAVAAPEQYYQQALQIDPTNPYAHVHWGHWIVWRRGMLEDAVSHFSAAVQSGRERAYVRRIQLAALRAYSSPETEAAFLRAIRDMVQGKEPIDARARNDVYSVYYFSFNSEQAFDRLNRSIPPTEQIAIIRGLFFDPNFDQSKIPLRDATLAILQEAAGLRDEALQTWLQVRAEAPSNGDVP